MPQLPSDLTYEELIASRPITAREFEELHDQVFALACVLLGTVSVLPVPSPDAGDRIRSAVESISKRAVAHAEHYEMSPIASLLQIVNEGALLG